MRRQNALACLALLCTIACLASWFGIAAARERVSVFDFSGNAGYESRRQATSLLTKTLVDFDRFTMVERADIDRILQEQSFQLTGIVSEETAVEVGKVLGISLAFLGQIDTLDTNWMSDPPRYEGTARISIKIIDVESGKLVAMLTASGSSHSSKRDSAAAGALEDCFDEALLVQLRKAFMLDSGVLKADNNEVYFLLGKEAGVKLGARFSILHIDDQAIAQHEAFADQIGLVEVTAVTANTARSRIIWTTAPVQPGDMVVEVAKPENSFIGFNLQTQSYTITDRLGYQSNGSTLGLTGRWGWERPFGYSFGGEVDVALLEEKVMLSNIGGFVALESPIVKGALYLDLQGEAGLTIAMQDYRGPWSSSGSAMGRGVYLGAGAFLKYYLTRDRGLRLEAGASGRYNSNISYWTQENGNYDVNVTDSVAYPEVGASSLMLKAGFVYAY